MPRARTRMTDTGPTAPMFAKPEGGFDTFAPEHVAPPGRLSRVARLGQHLGQRVPGLGQVDLRAAAPAARRRLREPGALELQERRRGAYPLLQGPQARPEQLHRGAFLARQTPRRWGSVDGAARTPSAGRARAVAAAIPGPIQEEAAMKVVVDYDLCEANALCVRACPEVFRVEDDDSLTILMDEIPESLRKQCENAVRVCPRQALRLEN